MVAEPEWDDRGAVPGGERVGILPQVTLDRDGGPHTRVLGSEP